MEFYSSGSTYYAHSVPVANVNITNTIPYGGHFGTGNLPAPVQSQFNQGTPSTSHVMYQTPTGWEQRQMSGTYPDASHWQAATTQTLDLFPASPSNGGRRNERRSLSRSPSADTGVRFGGQYGLPHSQSTDLTLGWQTEQRQVGTTTADLRRSRSRSFERMLPRSSSSGRSTTRQPRFNCNY